MALSTHRRSNERDHKRAQRSPGLQAPRHELPEHGLGEQATYELLGNELLLDGQARLNLATFVTTWMPSLPSKLMLDTADKNIIDKDEYPQTAEIEARCVNILADLWHSPGAADGEHAPATGCSTTGSSEAAMLAGMALKWRWRERMRAAGKPTDRPNLVAGANVQVCWQNCCSILGGPVRRRLGIIKTQYPWAFNAVGTTRYWDVGSRGPATGVLEA